MIGLVSGSQLHKLGALTVRKKRKTGNDHIFLHISPHSRVWNSRSYYSARARRGFLVPLLIGSENGTRLMGSGNWISDCADHGGRYITMLPADWSISTSHDLQGGGSENRTRFDLKYLSEEATRMRPLLVGKYPTRNFVICWATNMRLLASALLLLLVADFSLAGVHRLSTEQLHKSDLWKDATAHVLLLPEEGTLNNVNAGRCGASVRECGCFCLPPPDSSYLQARLSIFVIQARQLLSDSHMLTQ